MNAPLSATTAAAKNPARVACGPVFSVITIVNLLANRRALGDVMLSAPTGTGCPLVLRYSRVLTSASAYARLQVGMTADTQASHDRSASSRSFLRTHHTTGCHQYATDIADCIQHTQ